MASKILAAFEDGVFCDAFSFSLVSPNCPFSSSLPELLPSSLCFAVISFPSPIVHVRPCNFRCLIYISGSFVWMRLNFSPSCSKAQGSNSGPDRLCLTDMFCDFSHFDPQSCLIVQYIVPRPFNSTSFPVPTSLLVLSLHAVGCNPTY